MTEPSISLTLRDIAQSLGLSKSAVHYALHNSPRISEDTRQRVQAFAAKHGYQQNPTVSRLTSELRKNRTRLHRETLAYVHANRLFSPDEMPSGWAYKQYIDGAIQRAHEMGYSMDVIWLGTPGLTGKRIDRMLHARGISGFVISPFDQGYGHVAINWNHFIGVTVGHQMVKPRIHSVIANTFHAAEVALRRLKQLRYTRVGLALRPLDERFTNGSYLGAYLRWQHRQPTSSRLPVFVPANDRDWHSEGFLRWYHKYRPEVVLAVAPVVHGWLLAAGISVPEEVGVVLFDLGQSSEVSSWAGVDVQHGVMGREAVELLASDLNLNSLGVPKHSRTVLIEGVWRDGVTLRRKAP